MSDRQESFWNSKATGRDFFWLASGLASGAATAVLLLSHSTPVYQTPRMIDSPTALSEIVTQGGPVVGMYQIVVSDNVLWKVNTATGELHACGAGASTGKDQLTVVCAPLTPESSTPKTGNEAPQPRAKAKRQLASW